MYWWLNVLKLCPCSCELHYSMKTEVSKKRLQFWFLDKYHYTYSDGFIIITDFHLPDNSKLNSTKIIRIYKLSKRHCIFLGRPKYLTLFSVWPGMLVFLHVTLTVNKTKSTCFTSTISVLFVLCSSLIPNMGRSHVRCDHNWAILFILWRSCDNSSWKLLLLI